mgnify:CR=1 FL=1
MASKYFKDALIAGGKKLFDLAKGKGEKSSVATTIVGVNPAKNLTTKRKIQDNVTEAVDSAFKKADLPPSVRASMETKNKKAALKRDEGKKLKGLSYKLDKIEDKIDKRNKASKKLFKFNKGGRVGLKRGTFPDHSGDGKITQKDILMAKGVIPKTKKKTMMAKKSKSPMDKAVRKS